MHKSISPQILTHAGHNVFGVSGTETAEGGDSYLRVVKVVDFVPVGGGSTCPQVDDTFNAEISVLRSVL